MLVLFNGDFCHELFTSKQICKEIAHAYIIITDFYRKE